MGVSHAFQAHIPYSMICKCGKGWGDKVHKAARHKAVAKRLEILRR